MALHADRPKLVSRRRRQPWLARLALVLLRVSGQQSLKPGPLRSAAQVPSLPLLRLQLTPVNPSPVHPQGQLPVRPCHWPGQPDRLWRRPRLPSPLCGRLPAHGAGLRGAGQAGGHRALHTPRLPHRWAAVVAAVGGCAGCTACCVQPTGACNRRPRRPITTAVTSDPTICICICCAGDESAVMLDAHVEAGIMVGLPFGHQGVYDFGSHGGMTRRVSELGAVMLKHRLTPVSELAGGRLWQHEATSELSAGTCWATGVLETCRHSHARPPNPHPNPYSTPPPSPAAAR